MTASRNRLLRAAALALILAGVAASAPHAVAAPPQAGAPEIFADELAGPEGLAFTRDGRLIVGSVTGDLWSLAPDGSRRLLGSVPVPIAGVTVLSDGRVLAASVPLDQVWQVQPNGEASLFVEGIGGPNFIVESVDDGRIFASASNRDEIVEITGGRAKVVASGLDFANGLATRESGPRRYLYVALTLAGEVVRLPFRRDGSLGAPELFAEGLTLVDGIAFDRAGNLLAVGFDTVWTVDRSGRVEVLLEGDPLLNWPSNLAFGQGPGWSSRDVYLANFGPAFGDGTDVVRFRSTISGAPLAAVARPRPCGRGIARTRGGSGLARCR